MKAPGKIVILLTGILLLANHAGEAQVVVERSTNKVTISGVAYYVHIVKKGETLYSVSKAYNVTVEDIIRENPPAVKGINEEQVLRIPVREQASAPEKTGPYTHTVRDEEKYVYHILQAGQTIYSLSKLYGVSENDIVNANPGIEISRLPLNSEIAVPRKDFMTVKQDFAVQDTNYFFHKVVSGESMASIAQKYGMTLRELRRENRNMRFPQVGDYVRIPAEKRTETEAVVTIVTDTIPEPVQVMEAEVERPLEFTDITNIKGSFDVAVLLPFYLEENSLRTEIDSSRFVKGKRQYRTVTKPQEWIYNRSNAFIEMYEGILLAVDTLVSLGLNVNLHSYDIKSDVNTLQDLINRREFEDTDLIIGPVYSSNLSLISQYAGKRDIPVVSPVRVFDKSPLNGNKSVFLANPSLSAAQDAITEEVIKYSNANFVFIHTDTAGTDVEVNNFRNKIIGRLMQHVPFSEIKFREFIFYSRSVFGNDSINRLAHTLSATGDNILIIASEDDPVISETIQEVHALSKKYSTKLFVYPLIRGLDNLDAKYLFDLNLLVYSPFWIDYLREDVKAFNRKYRQKFLTEPTETSYAWLGYDIAYYFLSGMAVHGKEFVKNPGIHYPDLLHTEFKFVRKSPDGGFENIWLYPVRYSSDYKFFLDSAENEQMNNDIK